MSEYASKERFTGHEYDDETWDVNGDGRTGLYYAGARYYDPVIARWPTVDPLSGDYPGQSPYNYALNNPATLFDPTGACPEDGSEGDAGDGDGYCLAEITVEAERLDDEGSSAFMHAGTFYFDASTEEGQEGLYDFLRANPRAADQVLSGNFSPAAQQVAMTASIHNTQAEFMRIALRISLETGADFATVVALLSGGGTLAGAGAFLLRRGGIKVLTKQGSVNLLKHSAFTGLAASGTETGLRVAAVPVGGSPQAAGEAFTGLLVSGVTTGLPGVGVGVRATGLAGPAFRSASTGRFVTDLGGISVFGGTAALGSVPTYYFFFE